MAIKLPDPGNGIPEQKTGNDEWTNMKIVRDNFADQTHAASRLVGRGLGKIPVYTESGNGFFSLDDSGFLGTGKKMAFNPDSQYGYEDVVPQAMGVLYSSGSKIYNHTDKSDAIGVNFSTVAYFKSENTWFTLSVGHTPGNSGVYITSGYYDGNYRTVAQKVYTTSNTTKDGNGFLKAASPVVDLYDDHIDLNHDAETQGVEFIKNDTGDYTLKTKTGLRSDNTWRIEIPNDDNRNPLFAVDIDAQDDGTINIKCYKRIFNMQTFLFEPDLESPVDITDGRFISVRLNDNPEPEQTDEPAI